jgi:hypothetical protein
MGRLPAGWIWSRTRKLPSAHLRAREVLVVYKYLSEGFGVGADGDRLSSGKKVEP